MKRLLIGVATVLVSGLRWSQPTARGQRSDFFVKPVAEKKASATARRTAVLAGRELSDTRSGAGCGRSDLAGRRVAGKVWLFTLGPAGGSTPGATKVVEVGPVPPMTAREYLLRINHSGGPARARRPQCTRTRAPKRSMC